MIQKSSDKVIILGAGFSRALSDKMPLTNGIKGLSLLVNQAMVNHEQERIKILWKRHVVDKNIGNIADATKANFEDILTYLDDCHAWKGSFDKLEHQILYEALIPKIVREIKKASEGIDYDCLLKNEKTKKFITRIKEEKIPVITFNYDLILEWLMLKSLERCTEVVSVNGSSVGFEFINYFKYCYPIHNQSIIHDIDRHRFHNFPTGDRSLEIKILKLHGSINWLHSSTETSVVVDDLAFSTKFSSHKEWKNQTDQTRELFKTTHHTLLIPPTQNKTSLYLRNDQIKQQWVFAADLLSKAKQVYVVGYSAPITDTSSKLMLQSTINRANCEVKICYKEDDYLEERYEEVLPKTKLKFFKDGFFESSFVDSFCED